ncbi:aldehyde dehydrogenase family protein, partial [Streptomyces sp. GbtcB7]|uniref:aldehyde dehydrogenase family protein n=1 Tax=Streptomyces sp. GbtcB7 TaxID=2824752 RepID=UPI0020C6632D
MFPAHAPGCTDVIKPSEVTPTSTLRLAELCVEAGFPQGVVNVVTGFGRPTGGALSGHEGVAKIVFTGSTSAGKAMLDAAASRLGGVTLELPTGEILALTVRTISVFNLSILFLAGIVRPDEGTVEYAGE